MLALVCCTRPGNANASAHGADPALAKRGALARFHRDMTIFAALTAAPDARRIFEKHGMGCSLCVGAQDETIEAGAVLHHVDPEVVVAELNSLPAAED